MNLQNPFYPTTQNIEQQLEANKEATGPNIKRYPDIQFQKIKSLSNQSNFSFSKQQINADSDEEKELNQENKIESIRSIPQLRDLSPLKVQFVQQSTEIKCENHPFFTHFQYSPNQTQRSFQPLIYEMENKLDQLFFNPQLSCQYHRKNVLYVKIEDLSKLYPLNYSLSKFVKLDPSYSKEEKAKKLLHAFNCDWKLNEQRLAINEATCNKIRDKIILNFLTNLINQRDLRTIDSSKTMPCVNITARCMQAGLPIPPQQITPEYIRTLFLYPKIKSRLRYFIFRKLKVSLWEENFARIENYSSDIVELYHQAERKTIDSLRKVLEQKRKPFTNQEMTLIRKEGYKILSQFGRNKYRKANLINKQIQSKSPKIIQKKQENKKDQTLIPQKSSQQMNHDAQMYLEDDQLDFQFNLDSEYAQERHYISTITPEFRSIVFSPYPKEFDFF